MESYNIIKFGIFDDFAHTFGKETITNVLALNHKELIVSTSAQLYIIEKNVVKKKFPLRFSTFTIVPENDYFIGTTIKEGDLIIYQLSDFLRNNSSNNSNFSPTCLDKFSTNQHGITHIYYSPKSNAIITIGTGIKVFTIKYKENENPEDKPTITISKRSSFSSNYTAPSMTPPAFDKETELILLPTENGIYGYDINGAKICRCSKYPSTIKTIYATYPTKPAKLAKLISIPSANLLKREHLTLSKEILTYDLNEGMNLWGNKGQLINHYDTIRSSVLSIIFIDSENAICINSCNILFYLNIRTGKTFYYMNLEKSPSRLFLTFSKKNPILCACFGSYLRVLKLVIPWRVWNLNLEKTTSLHRCNKFLSAGRILIDAENSPIKFYSPRNGKQLCMAKTNESFRPVSYLYDRGIVENYFFNEQTSSYEPKITKINDNNDDRDMLFIVLQNGKILGFNPRESKFDDLSNKFSNCKASFMTICKFYHQNDFQWGYAVASEKGELFVYDYNSLNEIMKFDVDNDDETLVQMFFHFEINCFVLVFSSKTVLFDVEKGKIIDTIPIEGNRLTTLFSNFLVYGFHSGHIRRVGIESKKFVSFDSENKKIARDNKNEIVMKKPHSCPITGFSFAQKIWISAGLDGNVVIWNYDFKIVYKIYLPLPLRSCLIMNGKCEILVATATEIMQIKSKSLYHYLSIENRVDNENDEIDNFDLKIDDFYRNENEVVSDDESYNDDDYDGVELEIEEETPNNNKPKLNKNDENYFNESGDFDDNNEKQSGLSTAPLSKLLPNSNSNSSPTKQSQTLNPNKNKNQNSAAVDDDDNKGDSQKVNQSNNNNNQKKPSSSNEKSGSNANDKNAKDKNTNDKNASDKNNSKSNEKNKDDKTKTSSDADKSKTNSNDKAKANSDADKSKTNSNDKTKANSNDKTKASSNDKDKSNSTEKDKANSTSKPKQGTNDKNSSNKNKANTADKSNEKDKTKSSSTDKAKSSSDKTKENTNKKSNSKSKENEDNEDEDDANDGEKKSTKSKSNKDSSNKDKNQDSNAENKTTKKNKSDTKKSSNTNENDNSEDDSNTDNSKSKTNTKNNKTSKSDADSKSKDDKTNDSKSKDTVNSKDDNSTTDKSNSKSDSKSNKISTSKSKDTVNSKDDNSTTDKSNTKSDSKSNKVSSSNSKTDSDSKTDSSSKSDKVSSSNSKVDDNSKTKSESNKINSSKSKSDVNSNANDKNNQSSESTENNKANKSDETNQSSEKVDKNKTNDNTKIDQNSENADKEKVNNNNSKENNEIDSTCKNDETDKEENENEKDKIDQNKDLNSINNNNNQINQNDENDQLNANNEADQSKLENEKNQNDESNKENEENNKIDQSNKDKDSTENEEANQNNSLDQNEQSNENDKIDQNEKIENDQTNKNDELDQNNIENSQNDQNIENNENDTESNQVNNDENQNGELDQNENDKDNNENDENKLSNENENNGEENINENEENQDQNQNENEDENENQDQIQNENQNQNENEDENQNQNEDENQNIDEDGNLNENEGEDENDENKISQDQQNQNNENVPDDNQNVADENNNENTNNNFEDVPFTGQYVRVPPPNVVIDKEELFDLYSKGRREFKPLVDEVRREEEILNNWHLNLQYVQNMTNTIESYEEYQKQKQSVKGFTLNPKSPKHAHSARARRVDSARNETFITSNSKALTMDSTSPTEKSLKKSTTTPPASPATGRSALPRIEKLYYPASYVHNYNNNYGTQGAIATPRLFGRFSNIDNMIEEIETDKNSDISPYNNVSSSPKQKVQLPPLLYSQPINSEAQNMTPSSPIRSPSYTRTAPSPRRQLKQTV